MRTVDRLPFPGPVAALLPVVFFALGCASSGSTTSITPATERFSNYRSLRIDVAPGPASSEEITQLSSMIVAKLQERGLFETIYLGQLTPDAAADLDLRVDILALDRVSSTQREWLGAFAGKAAIKVTATMVDTMSQRTVAEFDSEGKSGGHMFAGGTAQAIDRTAEAIAAFIQDNM